MAHVFISHSKQDVEFVRYLKLRLEQQRIPVWLDESRLTPSTRWWSEIEASIESCGAFIVVMSPDGKQSDWVERELLLAEQKKKPIYPVLLTGDPWSRLANIQFADMRAGLRAPLPDSLLTGLRKHCGVPARAPERTHGIALTIQRGDIMQVESDVVALKYAQKFYGPDRQVADWLMTQGGFTPDQLMPAVDQHRLVNTEGNIAARRALFVGTVTSRNFDYKVVRRLAAQTLAALAKELPNTEHLTTTVHGIGFGLDESEVMRAQFAGYLDAIDAGYYPESLRRITVVELIGARLERLRQALDEDLRNQDAFPPLEGEWGYIIRTAATEYDPDPNLFEVEPINTAGEVKPYVYVVLPFQPQMEDLFYYGIQGAVHAAGLLCLRDETDLNAAESLETYLQKIDSAQLVIVDLTHSDPSVLLRLGYALGRQRPVVVIGSPPQEIFRLDGGASIRYSSIKSLETSLLAHFQAT